MGAAVECPPPPPPPPPPPRNHFLVFRDIPKSIAMGPGKNCPKFFSKRGDFRHKCKLQPCQLSAVFLHNYGLSEKDALELASFLEPMLEYNPAKRITAREALKHPWLEIHE